MIYSKKFNNNYNHQITVLYNSESKVLQIWSREIKQLFEDGCEHMISMLYNQSFSDFLNCKAQF